MKMMERKRDNHDMEISGGSIIDSGVFLYGLSWKDGDTEKIGNHNQSDWQG